MSSRTSKPDLARAGTMETTAEEGAAYQDRQEEEYEEAEGSEGNDDREENEREDNEREDNGREEERYADEDTYEEEYRDEEAEVEEDEEDGQAPPRLEKHSTMRETAEEGEEYLNERGRPDVDVSTRGQQRRLDEIYREQGPSDSTATTTAEDAKSSAGPTHTRKRRMSQWIETKKEAEAFYGRMRMTEGPWMRKRIARTKAFKLNQEARLDPVPAPAPEKGSSMKQEKGSSSKQIPKKLTAVVKIRSRNGKIIRRGQPVSNMKSGKSLSNAARIRSRHVSKKSLSTVARIRSKLASKTSLSNAARIRSRHVSKRSLSTVARSRSKLASNSKRSLSNVARIRSRHASKRSLSRVTKGRSSSNMKSRSQGKTSMSKIAKSRSRSRSPAKRSTSRVDRSKRSVSKGKASQSRSAKSRGARRR